MYTFLGDVHNHFKKLERIADGKELIIQVGDLGIGSSLLPWPDTLPENLRFIRGNHDRPITCKHPNFKSNYLGNYGVFVRQEDGMKFGYIGGAASYIKIEGHCDYNDSELPDEALEKAVALLVEEKPDIIFTHDAPLHLFEELLPEGAKAVPNRTAKALDKLFSLYQPPLWIFGHWHTSFKKREGNTQFIGLTVLETFDV